MHNQQIIELEMDIASYKEAINLLNSLETLFANKHFQKVILSGYFEKEAVRLVSLKADPSQQSKDKQEAIIKQIDSIGNLSEYFRTIKYKGELARRSISDSEQTLEEILRGDQ